MAARGGGYLFDPRATQKLRRTIDAGVGYGVALEGISASEVIRT